MGKIINILHIEDDPCYSKMFQIQLNKIVCEKQKYEFVFDVVASTIDAYQRLEENDYDCIISDYQIIKGCGLDILNEVKGRNIDVPFIFLTAQGDERIAREAFIRGANDYFTKDITIADYDRIYNSIINQITLFETKKLHNDIENKYQTIFENSNAGLMLIDEDMTIMLVNNEFEKFTGYEKSEIEGKRRWTEFVPEEEAEYMKKYHHERRMGNNAPKEYFFHYFDKNGKERYGFVSVSLIPNTKKAIASIIDQTELRNAILQLNKSESKYRNLFMNSIDAIWVNDMNGRIINCNEAALKLFGYSLEESRCIRTRDLCVDPEDADRFVESIAQNGFISEYDIKLKKKDGSELDCKLSVSMFIDEKGDIFGYQGIVRDVTEQKKSMETITHLNKIMSAFRNINQLILKENDKKRLLERTCEILTEKIGYDGAWIALFDGDDCLEVFSNAGYKKSFEFIHNDLCNGIYTNCAMRAISNGYTVAVSDPSITCNGCRVSEICEAYGALTKKLNLSDGTFGLISVSVPREYLVMDEEIELFKEISGALEFALQKLG